MYPIQEEIVELGSRCLVFVFSFAAFWGSAANGQTAKRRSSPDDFLLEERISSYSPSPDGKMIAYVRNSDVWLKTLAASTPRPIIQQKDTAAQYGEPKWSPGAQRLALLSQSGKGLGIAIWDRETGKVREVLAQELYRAPYGYTFFEWLDDSRIVCAALPEGVSDYGNEEVATQAWTSIRKGEGPTASILHSGSPSFPGLDQHIDLIVIDVVKDRSSRYEAGTLARISLGPDRRHIAFLKQEQLAKVDPESELHEMYVYTYDLTVIEVNEAGHFTPGFEYRLQSRFPDRPWIVWKPDVGALAVSARVAKDPLQWFVCGIREHECHGLNAAETIGPIQELRWSSGANLLAYAGSKEASDSSRHDWWLLRENASPTNLTADFPESPQDFISPLNTNSVFVLSGGRFWRIALDTLKSERLRGTVDQKIDRIIWPAEKTERVIIAAIKGQNGTEAFRRINLESDEVEVLPMPPQDATLAVYSVLSKFGVFELWNPDGQYFAWICQESSRKCDKFLQCNTFKQGTAVAEYREIKYRSLEGQDLGAQLFLPIDYRAGMQYPMVVIVYAGQIFENGQPGCPWTGLLAAHGYIVLCPSMPLLPGNARDPFMEMLNGVLPAVDKVVEMGMADRERVGLLGHSYGGYSVYSIVSQTNRFRAAVAMAGPADLLSLYGTFSGASRYTYAESDEATMENGQFQMGSPPWMDLGRYIRNSPISYVERIETPLMIVQGDEDYVPIEQGEEMFSALRRQKKRAEFVRYWGEGHVIENPKNQKDLWQRIYAWFDEYLTSDITPHPSRPPSEN